MTTNLHDALVAAGAVFDDDRAAPLHFGDPAAEASAAQDAVVVHDESDHRIFVVTGRDRVDLLQRISSNDLKRLQPGLGHYNCFTTNKGRIVDRVFVMAGDDSLMLRISPGRGDDVVRWIDTYTIIEDVKVADVSDQVRQVHLLGPRAAELARAAAGESATSLVQNAFCAGIGFGVDVTVVRTAGLLEHPGFLFLVAADRAAEFWTSLVAAGGAYGLRPIGRAAFEAVRARFGVPGFGREITEDHHPLEAGLWDSVSFTKGCYVGQEVIARLRTYDKVMKHLCRLRLSGPADRDAPLFSNGKEAGALTTVAGPPIIDGWYALGYVKKRAMQSGAPLQVGAADAAVTAEVANVVRLGETT